MSATAALRVAPLAAGDLDAAIALLPPLRFVKTDGGIFLACPSEHREVARVLLARAGARAEPSDGLPAPRPGLLPARANDLAPIRLAGVVDILTLRTLGAGEAAARLRRHGPFRLRRRDPGRLRSVLRGEDRLVGWRRVVWAERALFRAHELHAVHPIVFDRAAIESGDEGLVFAGAGLVSRWLRA